MKSINLDQYKKLLSSSGINFILRIFGLGASFLVTVLITRMHGVDDFGNYSLVFTISQAAALIFALGIPNTLIQLIGNNKFDYTAAKQLLKQGVKIVLLISFIPMAFFYLASDYLAVEIFNKPKLAEYFLIVTIALPLFVLHELFLYFFIATKKFLKYSIFTFVVPNVLLIIALYFLVLVDKSGPFTFIAFAASILVTVIAEAMFIFKIRPTKQAPPLTIVELLRTASPMMFSGLMLYLLNWTAIIMLGIMVSEEQVGIYNVAFKVGSVGFLVIVSVSTIITPRIAELYGESNLAGLKHLIQSSTRLVALLSIPAVIILIVFSTEILSFFGPEAAAGRNTLIIVAIGVLFSAVVGNVDQILNMTNNKNVLKNIIICCFIVNVILNYILIPRYGIEGAAIASLFTNVLINLLCLYYIKKRLGFYTLF